MPRKNRLSASPSPKILRDMERAAELRANGSSWTAIAKELARKTEIVRGWTRLHPDIWSRLLRAAAKEAAFEGRAEAILILRKMLRTDDDKLRRDVARALAALCRPVSRDGKNDSAAPESALVQLARYLETLDDAQICKLAEINLSDVPDGGISQDHRQNPSRPLRCE